MNRIILLFIVLFTLTNISAQEMPDIFGKLPIQYKDCELLRIQLKTSPEVIEKLKPKEITTDSTNTVLIYLVKQKYSAMDYDEVMVAVPGAYKDKKGEFMNILYLDKAAPIVGGREILGSPKADAKITFERTEKDMKVVLKRRGELLLSFNATFGDVNPMKMDLPNTHGFVIKKIPSVEGPDIAALKRLNSFSVKGLKFYDSQAAETFNLEYNPSEKHFLPNLGDYEVVSVAFLKMDFILDYGKVEIDYLKNAK